MRWNSCCICLFLRYCNSHLQVMGVLPKKERKKKQDTIESLALNITVPSLALKTHNGLEHLSPPPSLARLLPSDPFALYKQENMLQLSSTFLKKPQESQAVSQKQQERRVDSTLQKHPRSSSLSSTHARPCPVSPQTGRTTQTPLTPSSPRTPTPQTPTLHSGSLFRTSSPLQVSQQGSTETVPLDPKIHLKLTHDKKVVPGASGKPQSRDDVHKHLIAKNSVAMKQQAPCLKQLQSLMHQHKREYKDLNSHIGMSL